jgi:thiamine-phosphate pyrophosphorylase
MAALYSEWVTRAKTLPNLWLISDGRNDAVLERALAGLPRGSGFIFRHYHLDDAARQARFDVLAAAARAVDHVVILSGPAELARAWGADGIYGPPESLGAPSPLLRLAAAHDADEIAAANRAKADGVLLSPVFPTRTHPGSPSLGVTAFRQLAPLAEMPVIALGGMTAARAKALDWPRWAAIDGLSKG